MFSSVRPFAHHHDLAPWAPAATFRKHVHTRVGGRTAAGGSHCGHVGCQHPCLQAAFILVFCRISCPQVEGAFSCHPRLPEPKAFSSRSLQLSLRKGSSTYSSLKSLTFNDWVLTPPHSLPVVLPFGRKQEQHMHSSLSKLKSHGFQMSFFLV